MKTRITSPFNWRGQPSEIIAADSKMWAKSTQVNFRANANSGVHLKGSSPPMRDNTVSNFCTPIPGPADAAAQFRIKASSGVRA